MFLFLVPGGVNTMRHPMISLRRLAILTMLSIALDASTATAQQFTFSDDFSLGNRDDYIFVDSIGTILGTDFAELIPADGAIRITAPTTPDLALGPARSGFEFVGQPQKFSDFAISVDIVDWDDSLQSEFGPTARTREVGGIGTLDMYSMAILINTVSPDGVAGDFVIINRVDDEVPTTLGAEPFDADPTKQYQLRFSGTGPDFLAEVFDLAEPSTPLVTVNATDATYSGGGNGFAASTAGLDPAGWLLPNSRADVTLDNYSLTATVPEPSGLFPLLLAALFCSGCSRWRRR